MKSVIVVAFLSLVFIGCSKPPAEEYFKKAQDAEKGGLWKVALDEYQQLIDAHPESDLAETAIFNSAAIYHNNLQDFKQAVNGYKRYVQRYPSGTKAPVAMFLTGFLYNNELKMLDSAKVYYELFLEKYPTNEMATSAQFELQNLGKSPDEILPKEPVAETTPVKASKKAKGSKKN